MSPSKRDAKQVVAVAIMTKQIEAIYERGIMRPVEPLQLPEWARLEVIVITHQKPGSSRNAAKILAEIATMPRRGIRSIFRAGG